MLTAPDGARVAVRDAQGAVEAARRAPVEVDRLGSLAPGALRLQVVPPGEPVGGDCVERPLPTVDDPVADPESSSEQGTWVGGARLRGHEALRRRRMGKASVGLRVPPPAEQCGYRAEGLATH